MSAEPLLHFAQLDESNTVVHVALVTKEFLESNPDRYQGIWVETWQNVDGVIFAGVGSKYDPDTQTFTRYEPPVRVLSAQEKAALLAQS
jgi:hypothetical protein